MKIQCRALFIIYLLLGGLTAANSHASLLIAGRAICERMLNFARPLTEIFTKPIDPRLHDWLLMNEGTYRPIRRLAFEVPLDPDVAANQIRDLVRATVDFIPSSKSVMGAKLSDSVGIGLTLALAHELVSQPKPAKPVLEGPELAAKRIVAYLKSSIVGIGPLFIPPYNVGGVRIDFVRTKAGALYIEVDKFVEMAFRPELEEIIKSRVPLLKAVGTTAGLSSPAESYINATGSLEPILKVFSRFTDQISAPQKAYRQTEKRARHDLENHAWSAILLSRAFFEMDSADSTEFDARHEVVNFAARASNAILRHPPNTSMSREQMENFLSKYINKDFHGRKFSDPMSKKRAHEIFEHLTNQPPIERRMNLVYDIFVPHGPDLYVIANFNCRLGIDPTTHHVACRMVADAKDDEIHFDILPSLPKTRFVSEGELNRYVEALRKSLVPIDLINE